MKLQLPRLSGGYLDAAQLNEWANLLEAAVENTLSRDGTLPNALTADVDLNGQGLLNSGMSPDDPNAILTRSAVELLIQAAASGFVAQRIEEQVATAGQTEITLTTLSYEPETNNVAVYVDGLRVFDFTEDTPTQLTLVDALTVGQVVQIVTNDYLATASLPPHRHAWSDLTNVPDFATRWPAYSEVTDRPTQFTPAAHTHNASDINAGRMADAQRGVYVQASAPALGAGDAGALWFW